MICYICFHFHKILKPVTYISTSYKVIKFYSNFQNNGIIIIIWEARKGPKLKSKTWYEFNIYLVLDPLVGFTFSYMYM